MCNDTTKQAATIVKKIKKLLYNYDLTLVYATGEISLREANMTLYEGDKKRDSQRRFVLAKVEKERYQLFVDEVQKAKKEILNNLDLVLSKYTPRYKAVFIAYFIEEKNYDDICGATHYSRDAVAHIIQKLKADLIDTYIP